ncbi:hypothetical protein ACXEHT_004839 [Klebsiella variicola]
MSAETIAICASGPSLCIQDVHHLRDNKIPVITVNSSWMMYPGCQYIFAGDDAWWKANYHQINSPAERWTCSETAARTYGINYFEGGTYGSFNSGAVAILFAISLGAENVILLGYDCSLEKGIHWHGMHPGLHNPTGHSLHRWKMDFDVLAYEINRRANVINCSRGSRLTCFPCVTLESRLRKIKRYTHSQ